MARLTELWAAEGITHGLAPTAVELLRRQVGGYFWVADYGSQLIGFAYGQRHTSDGLAVIPLGEPYIEVDELYVRCGPCNYIVKMGGA